MPTTPYAGKPRLVNTRKGYEGYVYEPPAKPRAATSSPEQLHRAVAATTIHAGER